ncbi:glycosyltransferase [Curtobacterium sp. UCD-KPL2560]|uniref:glycosyltransferase n=1 Tax=Curtobacterium sp. UCD-KPL2560 TaxID=1885315 RepID=UPI000825C3E5|nr:glycosyltransferase [Curtobacterium sp. UCD-KPL2560]
MRRRQPRRGTLFVKTSDATVDVVLRGQLRHLVSSELAPIAVAAGDSGRLASVGVREGVPVHALPLRRDPSPLDDLRALAALVCLMARLRPAQVVYGTPKATLLASVAATCTGVPSRVQVLHGLRLETTSGIRRRLLLGTEHLAVRLSTHVVAVGHGLRARCAELGMRVDRMTVLGAGSVVGVDVERATSLRGDPWVRRDVRRLLGAGDDDLVIGFVGRLTRDKGVEELVRAAVALRSEGLPVRLALVGLDEGLDELDEDVRAALHEEWVVRTGNVADPSNLYTGFDAFCLPSYREGLSTVLLEAWAAAVPVVVSDCTGLGDVVEDGVTGLVAPVGDVGATTTALRATFTRAEEASRRAERAREIVERDFATTVVWENFRRFLDEARRDRGRRATGGRTRRP